MSNIIFDPTHPDFDIDAASEAMDRQIEVRVMAGTDTPADYVHALERHRLAEEAWRAAIKERDIVLASYTEQIRLLKLRAVSARAAVEGMRVKRPVGRPRRYSR